MSTVRKFLFSEDFRGPTPEEEAARAAAERAAQEEALRQAFARGVEEGRRQAAAENERRLEDTMQRLTAEASARFAALDLAIERTESEALAYFDALARKLAGSALAEQPLSAVADAATAAFRHLRGVPHLVARVATPIVEDTDSLLRRIGRESGFEGRIIVIGDEDLGPGDVRLEWAEGGVARDRVSFERAIESAVGAAGAPSLDDIMIGTASA
jgi:flagellar assembly protein FliH